MQKILLVDDGPLNLALLHAQLDTCGYELLDATTGEAALELAARVPPDLVLLDVRMPGIGGFETCRRLKRAADARAEFLPIVLLTAHDEPAARRQGLDAGANDFLGKPFDPIELTLRIHNLLALRSSYQAVERNQATALVNDLKHPASSILANLELVLESAPLADTTMMKPLNDAREDCRRMLRLLAEATPQNGTPSLSAG
jgi:DNA-binding response OmpR family regulator